MKNGAKKTMIKSAQLKNTAKKHGQPAAISKQTEDQLTEKRDALDGPLPIHQAPAVQTIQRDLWISRLQAKECAWVMYS